MGTTMEELALYMLGWSNYFGSCETPEMLIYPACGGPIATEDAYVAAAETSHRRCAALLELGGHRASRRYRWQRVDPSGN
ncbi:MAG: hypothetical protein LAP39_01905 [Acidobacteriia bacterium]|nr:hypothetical protein [Terriglobia bacterium]